MNYWITTDTHLGHLALIDYCSRPVDFAEKILNNHRNIINSDDVLIHLGDFCIGDVEYWHEVFMGIGGFKKWLVKGNHDKKTNTWYLSHGWDFVGDMINLNMLGSNILFSHRPQDGDWFDINIHGHCHNNKRDPELIDDGRHKLVTLEHHYSPLSLRAIIERF